MKALTPFTLALSLILTGCATTHSNQTTSNTKAIPYKIFKEEQTNLLLDKILKSNFAISYIYANDKQLMKTLLKNKQVNKEFEECTLNNQKFDITRQLVRKDASKTIANNKDKINLWLQEIDFLLEISQRLTIKEKVYFNFDNLEKSLAFNKLNKEDSAQLIQIIQNKEFAPLLRIIGFPSVDDMGKLTENASVQADWFYKGVYNVFVECREKYKAN
ncbi:MAG: hypothetical protein KGV51_03920 [Moraxellaceae bacterium]|nr:hypothetical protein [Moraxellaceae bacterium]